MLQKRLTRNFYYLVCDRCDNRAPGSPVKDEAISQAIEAGWKRIHKWNGLTYVHTDLCPDCYKEKGE